jgi:hypothetical protein
MKYVIPDVPRIEGFAKLVDKLLAGATLPPPIAKPAKPTYDELVKALADVVDKITRSETLTLSRCNEIMEIRARLFDLGKSNEE